MKKDLDTSTAISEMVHTFYTKVQKDELIGPIFNGVIEDRWPQHLEKMVGFWETILLNERKYFGSPFAKHAPLSIEKKHFERWLELFNANLALHFEGPLCEEAKKRAKQMALTFQYKLEHHVRSGQ